MTLADTDSIHGTSVCYDGRAVLMIGPSNSGKSSLALQLLALGCRLVSDDRVTLQRISGRVVVEPSAQISGLIEARGVGLLNADYASQCALFLVIDMGRTETARLPIERTISFLGVELPLLHKSVSPHFPASILQYLKAGRRH
jgi:HPr kinase/phosphorylase